MTTQASSQFNQLSNLTIADDIHSSTGGLSQSGKVRDLLISKQDGKCLRSSKDDDEEHWISFSDIIKALTPGKTALCRHDHSCIFNATKGFLRSFIYALGLKLFVNNIGHVASPAKLLRNLMSVDSWRDNLRFVIFAAAMNGIYKTVLCFLRRIFNSDKIAAPIAGFMAGLCCMIDTFKRRRLILMLLLTRLTSVSFSMGEARNLVKDFSAYSLVIFLVSSTVAQICFMSESDCIDPKLKNFVKSSLKLKGSNFGMLIAGRNAIVDRRISSRMLSNWHLTLK